MIIWEVDGFWNWISGLTDSGKVSEILLAFASWEKESDAEFSLNRGSRIQIGTKYGVMLFKCRATWTYFV